MAKPIQYCKVKKKKKKKTRYIYTMQYYSAIEKNEVRSFVETWIDLENVIHTGVSQKDKNKYHILIREIDIYIYII